MQADGGIISYTWAVNAADGMSVAYRVGYGSQMDGKALREIKAELEGNGISVKGVILGSEFCNADNLGQLSEERIPYVVRVKEDVGAHKELVEKYGKELRLCNVHYLIQRSGLYGVSQKVRLFKVRFQYTRNAKDKCGNKTDGRQAL